MREIFQNYEHYCKWLCNAWGRSLLMDALIIKNNLVIERDDCCNGEPYRTLTRREFVEMELRLFGIEIPS